MRGVDQLRGHLRAVIALAALVAACEPWYRDQENLGRRITDTRAQARQVAAARAELAAGHSGAAAARVGRVVEINPLADADVYALDVRAAGGGAGADRARAYGRWRLQLYDAEVSAGRLTPERWEATTRDLRTALVASYVADDRTADALDVASTAADFAAIPAYAELEAAVNQDSWTGFERWSRAYGVPDHRYLQYGRAKLLERRPDPPRDAATLADEALAGGHLVRALLYYAEAFRTLPDRVLVHHVAGLARAAAAVKEPARANPEAYRLALRGDAELRAGHVGRAIHAYRRAVAEAPWWATAHHNLAQLLAGTGHADGARIEAAWAGWLRGGGRGASPLGVSDPSARDRDGGGIADRGIIARTMPRTGTASIRKLW
jgi:hypothetical protein